MNLKRSYGFNLLMALDQLINALFWGNPDETISSRAYRRKTEGSVKWKRIEKFIDFLFYFDRVQASTGHVVKHCELSFLVSLRRRQSRLEAYMTDSYKSLIEELKRGYVEL